MERLSEYEVLEYIAHNPSLAGDRAKKSFWVRMVAILGALAILMVIIFGGIYLFNKSEKVEKPLLTTRTREGRVYADMHGAYTLDKRSYTFRADDYGITKEMFDSEKHYSHFGLKYIKVYVFLDPYDNILGVKVQHEKSIASLLVVIIASFIGIIVFCVTAHRHVGRTWGDYLLWYSAEIEPLKERLQIAEPNEQYALQVEMRTKEYYKPVSKWKKHLTPEERTIVSREYRNQIGFTIVFLTLMFLWFYFRLSPLGVKLGLGIQNAKLVLETADYIFMIVVTVPYTIAMTAIENHSKARQLKLRVIRENAPKTGQWMSQNILPAKFCVSCGYKLESTEVKYCPRCGNQIYKQN